MTDGEVVETVDVLGVTYAAVTLEGAIDQLERWIRASDRKSRFVAATGFHGLWTAQKEPSYRRLLNEADFLCPDGVAPVLLSRWSSRQLPGRVPGPDLMEGFLERADERGYASYFLGDTEETLGQLRSTVERRFPGHRVAGTHSPPFRAVTEQERRSMVQAINASGADVLWVALGTPKQERWIVRHRAELDVPVAVGVGAAFRFLTGQTQRAPEWVGRMGLEWAWRLAVEPRKLWRRTLIEGPRFVAYALRELLRGADRSPPDASRSSPPGEATDREA